MHKVFENNYSICKGKSGENKCRSSGGAQEKGKTPETPFMTKIGGKTSLDPILICKIFIPS
jgi:hypothetical protein